MLLEKRGQEALTEFLDLYATLYPIDKEKARRLIREAVHHYKTEASEESYQGQLEKRWYESIVGDDREGVRPAYELYDDEYYFTDMWVCWRLYSRGYLRTLMKSRREGVFERLRDIKSVVDLGCGISYTTAALTELFPEARVYGTNLEDTRQYEFGRLLSKEYGFRLIPSIWDIDDATDLVFASEYFEHVHLVIEHLEDILTRLKPRWLYIANSFNTVSYGHFEWYRSSRNPLEIIHQTQISKEFNKTLRGFGYQMIRTKNWNQRPMLWEK